MSAGYFSDRRRVARDIEAYRRLDYEHNLRLAEEFRRQREGSAQSASAPTAARCAARESGILFFGESRSQGRTRWRPLVSAIRAARRVLAKTGGRARNVAQLAAAVAAADAPSIVREELVSVLWRQLNLDADEARRFWFFIDNGTFPAWQLW